MVWKAHLLCAVLACACTTTAGAQTPEQFYAGKTVTLIVGSTPGGYYDIGGRIIARYFGRYIPGNPSVVVSNQPGAAGLASVNKLGNTADRDGRTLLVMGRAIPQLALVGDPNAAFDPLQLTWIGSVTDYRNDAYMMAINASHPAKSIADLRAPKSLHLGGTSGGATNIIFALIARDVLKLGVEITKGYPGAAQIWLAMERGEVDGQFVDISAIMVGRPQLWREGKLRAPLAFGRLARHPDYPDVPVGRELVSDPADLALLEFAELPFFMALPLVAPPGVPADRAQALKTAFLAMSANEAFRADMLKAGIIPSPIGGEAVYAQIAKAAKAPDSVKARFAKLLSEK
jgi:tripartite-type tricarboxylate transporter receptor subunit TctC